MTPKPDRVATSDLIGALVAQAVPVRRSWPPLLRAAAWLALAWGVVAALAALHGTRPDLDVRLAQPAFCASLAATLLTGASAAIAAFTVILPDRSRRWLLLPVPAAVAWLATVGWGCLAHWVPLGPGVVEPHEAARCFATLLFSFVPLSALMFWMLRRAARLRPTAAVLAGSVAVAALTAAALSLLHPFDASAMVLMWNFGAATLVIATDAAIGRRLLRPAQ